MGNPNISIRRQCDLLNISKSSLYYSHGLSDEDLRLMNFIDEIYTKRPFYGNRRITKVLQNKGEHIWRKKVRKLMQILWIEAIYPKKKTSIPNNQHHKYPYLLKWYKIKKPNEVRATDITYIRLRHWRVYLVAIMDWFSRYIVAWDTSITLELGFCVSTLKQSLKIWVPEIFNTDQGSQFTSNEFVSVLQESNVKISMDGKWRAYDNIFTERLWRTIKYEDVYLKDYENPLDAHNHLRDYINFYNNERIHSSLDYKTPSQIHFSS